MATSVSEAATEMVAGVAEEVADQVTLVALSSRRISSRELGLIFGGITVGAGLGSTLSFIFSRRRLEVKYNQIAEEEIAKMREHYQAKVLVSEDKGELEEIVAERGYAVMEPPLVVAPPTKIVEAAANEKEKEQDGEPQEIEDTIKPEAKVRNIFKAVELEDDWDYHQERARRSPVRPYVIHRDERGELDYTSSTLTYYEEDDVLCDDRDQIVDDRERLVGDQNLGKFGHGSGDANIVYIRNDDLQIEMEVVKSPNSYAEEVHGFQHADGRQRRERLYFDDE